MILKIAEPSSPRIRINIRGLVQGVGFRPHVYQVATSLRLAGWVKNDDQGVTIEVEGRSCEEVALFLTRLHSDLPPLARIDECFVEAQKPIYESEKPVFSIMESDMRGPIGMRAKIIPDAAVCQDCLAELFDPNDRHYGYPFLNCTHCGPRYTIVRGLPYDRAMTSMAAFSMCVDCANEYHDPSNRRFHAQPVACPVCGPTLSHSLESIAEAILAGRVLAMKSLGGFHLVCDASQDLAVKTLRERKYRESKPLAVMTLNVASARRIAHVNQAEATWLCDKTAPIILLDKNLDKINKTQGSFWLSPSVAPGLDSIGVMLPYTPLHYLVFAALFQKKYGKPSLPHGLDWLHDPLDIVLVMTSANLSDEPIVIDNVEAKTRLAGIADMIVDHNREILVRTDDSVVRLVHDSPMLVRRSRGFAPDPIHLNLPKALTHTHAECPVVVAFGAELKNTICVTRGDQAFVSQFIGDLDQASAQDFLNETVEHMLRLLEVTPSVIAHDLHGDFFSTRLAEAWQARWGIPNERVYAFQHHQAHIASVKAEYGLEGPMAGLALDGFGLSAEGESWGGELLMVDGHHFERLGHLAPIAQPGGDKASRESWRMAVAVLMSLGKKEEALKRFGNRSNVAMVIEMIEKSIQTPQTSSCGRLFDAAAALCGVCVHSRFEAEAAMLFESFAADPAVFSEGWRITEHDGKRVIDFFPLFEKLLTCDVPTAANLFHGTLAKGFAELVQAVVGQTVNKRIILSGGCMANKIFTKCLCRELGLLGFEVCLPRRMPPNDGGISLGQAFLALTKEMS